MGLTDDPYVAYCLDEATWMWGRYVEQKLSESKKDAKNEQVAKQRVQMAVKELFGDDATEGQKRSGFKDPAAIFGG